MFTGAVEVAVRVFPAVPTDRGMGVDVGVFSVVEFCACKGVACRPQWAPTRVCESARASVAHVSFNKKRHVVSFPCCAHVSAYR